LDIKPTDHFCDLGSGVGKTVLYLSLHTNCKTSIGVELAETRHNAASQAKLKLKKCLSNLNLDPKKYLCPIVFKNEDILKVDFSQCTVVFWNNFCFPADFTANLMHQFKILKKGTKILTFKPLCSRHSHFCALHESPCCFFDLTSQSELYASWTHHPVGVYVYTRN